MNKWIKAIIAVLAAINVVFSIFIPITIGLMAIGYFDLEGFRLNLVMSLAIISSLFRAIDVAFLRG